MNTFKKFTLTLFVSLFTIQPVFADLAEDLGTIVVTATRGEQQNYEIAGNVTVITKDQIQASNAQSIPDILKEALGVHITDNSTLKSSIVDIRGFGDTAARNILVLVNGRKINNVDISGPDLIQIPIEAVDRIEIIRGASSVLYGDNAVGGVVNIITKKGEGKPSGRLGGTLGSYDANSVDGEISGAWKDQLSYYFYSQYLDKRGYRENSDLLAKDVQTRFGYDINENYGMDVNIGWHKDVQELPGGLTATEIETLGRKATSPNNMNDTSYTTDRYFQLTGNVTPWPEDIYYGHFVVDLNYRNRDVYDEFNGFGPFHTKRNIDTVGVTTKYIFNRDIFNRDVNFITGVDFYDTQNDILGSGDNVDDITITKEELGIFGFLEYELFEKLFVNGGTRYQQAEYDFDQHNVVVQESQRPDEWVSMGGTKYEYAKGSNIHMNVQQTFRFLATDEWYSTANFPGFGITPGLNLELEQQTGIQYEAGVKHNFNDKALVTVTPYWIDMENEIFFDPVTFANSNYDKTRRIGVEFGNRVDLLCFLDLDFLSRLELLINYNYQKPQFLKGISDGKDIPMVPRHQAGAGFLFGFWDHYNVSLLGKYVGSRFAINDTLNETTPEKPYLFLDLKLAYEAQNFEIFTGINNLTNEKYSTFVSKSTFSSTKNYFPAPERNFTAGVNFKF